MSDLKVIKGAKIDAFYRSWPEQHPAYFPCFVMVDFGHDREIEIADDFDDGFWDIRGQGQWPISEFPNWIEIEVPLATGEER